MQFTELEPDHIIFDVTKKHDAIWIYDCRGGNPNGDPDADNYPRTDPETQHGLVTDACLKRKLRNYIDYKSSVQPNPGRYKIYMKDGAILNSQHERAYTSLKMKPEKKLQIEQSDKARSWMCHNFFDIRMFGAVMSTGEYVAGQVRGAIQVTFGRSLSPVFPIQMSITRCARTKPDEDKENKTMGRKALLHYGLYRTSIFFLPELAKFNNVDTNDLRIFWESVMNCWECDRSASRGTMATQKLVIFSHESPYGNFPFHKLEERLDIIENKSVPRKYSDYDVILDSEVPKKVTLTVVD